MSKEAAYKDYMGGMKYKDIAAKYKVSLDTVKSWKQRYKWDRKGCTPTKKGAHKEKECKEPVAEEVRSVMENPNLTDKQRLFCLYYAKSFNATQSYKKAYGVQYASAMALGSDLLRNVKVRDEITRLKQARYSRALLEPEDLFRRYMDIAFSDITDYMTFGQEDTPIIGQYGPLEDQESGQVITEKTNVANLLDSSEVDGSLITELSVGRSGTKIKLADKLKAMQWLTDHMDMGTELQRAQVEKLRAEIGKMEKETNNDTSEKAEYNGIPANMIAPVFSPVLFHIESRDYLEYVFPGGRGSTKSSFISLCVIDLLMKDEQTHACVMRQVADTLRGSVYNQILWAIDALGLNDDFHATVSPLEITRKSTGQKIYFRGADDPGKVKSIKVPFGYISTLWFEELDQFAGPESVRKIEQSVIRGGDTAYIFKSFNPPKTASNWANKYIKVPKDSRLVTESTYKDVPEKWLGKPFLDEAEFLKTVNPSAYENEYMGVANGAGGNVFENVSIRRITAEEIAQFDRRYKGVDWGWYPDPYHYTDTHYDAARMTLYIFDEYRCNKRSNLQTADELKRRGVTGNDLLTCDSAENKSIGDYKSYGLLARGADRFPGSVDYSTKWLQSLKEIVIDNERCPETANEFLEYEYERDKEGEVISGYPDKNNHAIDAVRYATFPVWKKRGQ